MTPVTLEEQIARETADMNEAFFWMMKAIENNDEQREERYYRKAQFHESMIAELKTRKNK